MISPRRVLLALCLVWGHGLGLVSETSAEGPPLAVTGTIHDRTGTALAGALVELLPVESAYARGVGMLGGRAYPRPGAIARSDASGRFVLTPPRAGLWSVVVEAPGFVPMEVAPLAVLEAVELEPAVLVPSVGSRLRVVDPDGQPVAGAQVWAAGLGRRPWATGAWRVRPRRGVTSQEGLVMLARADEERLVVHVVTPGFSVLRRGGIGSGETLRLTVAEPGRAAVRTAAGEPAGGVLVEVKGLPVAVSTEDGTAISPAFANGEELRVLMAAGQRYQAVPESRVGAEPLLVLPVPVRLRGRVLTAAGREPLAGAWVWPEHDPGLAATTDSEGAYQLPATSSPRLEVQAAAVGHLPASRPLAWRSEFSPRAPTLALVPASAATGLVVDEAGLGVPGASVRAFATTRFEEPFFFSGPPPRGYTTSGSGGRFRISALRPGEEYQLRVTREGFAPARIRVAGLEPFEEREGVRVVLSRGRTLAGRVVDGAGQPLADVHVELTMADHRPRPPRQKTERGPEHPYATSTGEDGLFEIARVPAGKMDLSFSKPGFAAVTLRALEVLPPSRSTQGHVPAAGPRLDLGDLVLEPGARLAGRVVDLADEPVAGAEVVRLTEIQVSALTTGRRFAGLPAEASSDAEGRFEIADLPPGERLHLLVRRSGYRPSWVDGVEASGTEPLTVVLSPTSRIQGRVVDQAGRGVAGARVSARVLDPMLDIETAKRFFQRDSAESTTDRAGRFVLELLPGPSLVDAWAPGYVPVRGQEVTAGSETDPADLEVILGRGAVLEGRVLDAGGEPVVSARVAAGPGAGVTDADGFYRAEGVPLGMRNIVVDHREYPRLEEEVEIRDGTNHLDLAFGEAFALTGRVVDASGEGLEGTRLYLVQAEDRLLGELSGAAGAFRFDRVSPGDYLVEAEKPGYAPRRLDPGVRVTDHPVSDLVVRLDSELRVGGRLLGLGPEDLARARVFARHESGRQFDGYVASVGRYEIGGLAPGDWQIGATVADGRRQVTKRQRLLAGQPPGEIDLDFGRGLVFSGQVLHGSEPLAGATLSLRGRDVAFERRVRADYRGHFRLEDVAAGSYRLQVVLHREHVNHSADLRLDSDRYEVIDIASARLAGRVIDAGSGLGLAAALVVLERQAAGETAFMITHSTGEDGTFVVPRIAAGSYRLRFRKAGFAVGEELLTLSEHEDLGDLEVALEPAGGLELAVRLSDGTVPPFVTVAVLDPSGGTRWVENLPLDESGRTRHATLPSGTWDLLVTAPRGATVTVRADTSEGLTLALPIASRLTARVPELSGADPIASLVVRDARGLAFRGLGDYGALRQTWPVIAGKVTLNSLPPGDWILEVSGPHGRVWTGSISTRPGEHVEVRLAGAT